MNAPCNWIEAHARVKALATEHGITEILYGAGYSVAGPHAMVTTLDALSGEGMGYHVAIYPQGDRPGMPCVRYTVQITA